jgi:hypothetical protein
MFALSHAQGRPRDLDSTGGMFCAMMPVAEMLGLDEQAFFAAVA